MRHIQVFLNVGSRAVDDDGTPIVDMRTEELMVSSERLGEPAIREAVQMFEETLRKMARNERA